jgi:hypothetical protein
LELLSNLIDPSGTCEFHSRNACFVLIVSTCCVTKLFYLLLEVPFGVVCVSRSANFLRSAQATLVRFSKWLGAGIPWASDLGRLDPLDCRRWAHDASWRYWSWFVFRIRDLPQTFLAWRGLDTLEHDGRISSIYDPRNIYH